jgi:hypothetical protein
MFPNQEQTITVGFGQGLPVQFVLQNLNFEKLREVVPKFLEEARKDPVFANVDANLKFNKPELQVIIDRLKAAELGVNVLDVSQSLQLAFPVGASVISCKTAANTRSSARSIAVTATSRSIWPVYMSATTAVKWCNSTTLFVSTKPAIRRNFSTTTATNQLPSVLRWPPAAPSAKALK